MNKIIMVEYVQIEFYILDGVYNILIGNPKANILHQVVACPIDLIQRKSDVWDYVSNWAELTDQIKSKIEHLMKPELLQLL